MKIMYVDIGLKIIIFYEYESKFNKIVYNFIFRLNNFNNESGDVICNWNVIYIYILSEF